jgi:hypothetical protein
MAKLPVRREKRLPKKTDDHGVPTTAGASASLSFRYSYTEISAVGADASVKHTETRLENGTLRRESFEGSFDRARYDELMRFTGECVQRQMALAMRSLFWFLPAPEDDPRRRR